MHGFSFVLDVTFSLTEVAVSSSLSSEPDILSCMSSTPLRFLFESLNFPLFSQLGFIL